MGISVFPSGGGEFVTNDFVIDMNDTSNNVASLGTEKAAGSYGVTLASGDSSFDIYAIDSDGNSVGYTNDASLVASAAFSEVVILGVADSEVISFDYNGAVSNTDSEGDAPGAGAYLVSISPSDLPNVDDTANVIGGNFATDVEIYFESGTVSTAAKQVARADSTALIITRPDTLDPELDPWDVKAINPGVTPPTGTNAHILAGTVDAGATPVWSTTSPLPLAVINQAYSATVVATDPDGSTVDYSVTSGSLATGLSLDGSTGVISGTPTTSQATFEITASDGAGGTNPRNFDIPMQLATGGSVSTADGKVVHTFTSTDDLIVLDSIASLEYVVVAGGGGGGGSRDDSGGIGGGGGGGAGGYRCSVSGEDSGGGASAESTIALSAGTVTITVGAGGIGGVDLTPGTDGGSSSIGTVVTTVGGGKGSTSNLGTGNDGGSGGGGGGDAQSAGQAGGSGTANEGFDGGASAAKSGAGGGGGGGANAVGADGIADTITGQGGSGLSSSIDGTATVRAAGGTGGQGGRTPLASVAATQPTAGAGALAQNDGGDADSNSGSGGGGSGAGDLTGSGQVQTTGGTGGSGIVIVRY